MKKAKRSRSVPLRVWLSEQENAELNRKAKMAKLPKSTVIRLLVNSYEPREAPGERFYEAMKPLYALSSNLNQLTRKANTLGFADAVALADLTQKLTKFQLEIEQAFLRPAKSELRWK